MKLSCMRMLLFLLGCIVCFHEMANLHIGFVNAKTFHNLRDFEIEEQLKVVNKPAVKIIQTIHGDTYGCVGFYKQPAFDHPLMNKNLYHYKMRRTSSLKNSRANNETFGFLWENGVGCPIGTVPIKRVAREEISRLNSFSNKYKPQSSWNFTYNRNNAGGNGYHYAVSRTKLKGKKYNGATMTISINNPRVKSPQFSSGRMHVQIGNDFIQTGWTVHPNLFSDDKTRMFVFTKSGKDQCWNNMCPAGPVSVRSDFPLGLVRAPPCVRGSGKPCFDTYGLLKDEANGNWWLEFGGQQIGFWPASRFRQSFIDNVEWGGEVYSEFMLSPQMGNGYFPDKHPDYDAIVFNRTLLDEHSNVDDEAVTNTDIYVDKRRVYDNGYNIIDGKRITYKHFPVKHIIFFGGPGNI